MMANDNIPQQWLQNLSLSPSSNVNIWPNTNFTGLGLRNQSHGSLPRDVYRNMFVGNYDDNYNDYQFHNHNSIFMRPNHHLETPVAPTRNIHYNVLSNQHIAAAAPQYCRATRPRNIIVEFAKTRNGSIQLQAALRQQNHILGQEIFKAVLSNIYEVMTDEYGHHLFQGLLTHCNDMQFRTIFNELVSNTDLFIHVALQKHGSTAVQTLIRKLKVLGLGHTITPILSERFLELMTSSQGRYVVQQCFNCLKHRDNEVLYDEAVRYFKELATSENGCASLNVCLNCISGDHKTQLFSLIAEHSEFLANDPWGNYVVQNVLMFKDEDLTKIICARLKRQYINLSQKKGGSHVVERCIEASKSGMESVVTALLENEKALVQLASDQFGNYVVQRALKVTKEMKSDLHQSLLKVLKAHSLVFSYKMKGKHVASAIRTLEGENSVENDK